MRNLLFLLLGLAFLLAACNPNDDFLTGSEVELRFSVDTLRFDTVFTQVGSATRSFTVQNTADRPVRIDRIQIEGASGVRFRMNADGFPGNDLRDIEIWPNDSIHVFVEVTIDPNQPAAVSPYVVEDRVVFYTGEKTASVLLEAWGQNANYFPSRFNKGVPVLLSCDNQTITWNSPLPYVIYGEILIDSCLLQVAAGTRIYVHGGIARNDVFGVFNDGLFYTLANGRLHINGTADEPVIIQGDRLEEAFQEGAGQWLGIIIGRGSRDNRVEYTTIKNSIFGVLVDSAAELSLKHTQIFNTAGNGISGIHATIKAENCLIHSNAANSVQLTHGGDYTFDHCTVASYGVDAGALALTNFQCYNEECSSFNVYRMNARFRNCILFGSRNDELILADATSRNEPTLFNLSMQNCIVKVRDLLTSNNGRYADFFSTYCQGCISGTRDDKLFLEREMDDYRLDSLSIAIDKGLLLPEIGVDLEGAPRDALPDIGCYERQK